MTYRDPRMHALIGMKCIPGTKAFLAFLTLLDKDQVLEKRPSFAGLTSENEEQSKCGTLSQNVRQEMKMTFRPS